MLTVGSRRRVLRLALVPALFLLVAAAIGGAWTYRIQLAAATAIRLLEERGFGPADLTVRSIALESASTGPVSLYGGAMRADGLTLRFRPGELRAGRVQSIELQGLRTSIEFDDDQVLIGGRLLPTLASPATAGPLVAFVTLRDAEIMATLPGFPAPLRLAGNGRLENQTLTFELTATMVADRNSTLEMLIVGRHHIPDQSGLASVSVKTLKFHKHSKQPQDVLPALAGRLPPIDGEARASGTVSWKGHSIVPDLHLRLKDSGFETDQATVRSLGGDLHITQLTPPATAAHQVLTATISPGGLSPSKLTLRFELMPKPAIRIEDITSEFAGGTLRASPFIVDPSHPAVDTMLKVSSVELDRIFHLLDIDGLAGQGQIGGQISLHVRNGKLLVDDSRLVGTGPGKLNINSAWLNRTLGGNSETLSEALHALSDFHYDVLTIDLDRRENGEGFILLHLEGRSPTAHGDRTFNFNIRVESNFDRLTDIALQSIAAAHDLLQP